MTYYAGVLTEGEQDHSLCTMTTCVPLCQQIFQDFDLRMIGMGAPGDVLILRALDGDIAREVMAQGTPLQANLSITSTSSCPIFWVIAAEAAGAVAYVVEATRG